MDRETEPKMALEGMTRNRKQIYRYLAIIVAAILLISPDPFTDVLAFAILGKVGVSIDLRALSFTEKLHRT